jgi:hypothetical protein
VSIDSTRSQNDSLASSPPPLPQAQQQQSRLDRLKKQFSHLKTHEDPTKQNIKLANLKMEVGEAGNFIVCFGFLVVDICMWVH